MRLMTAVLDLWENGHLPIRDGVYTATGRAHGVRIDSSRPGGLEILDEFDAEAFVRADPDWVTSIDITREIRIPNGAGYLCCGEGSYGSEGFFARLDDQRRLVWSVYLEESNPFIGISVDRTRAVFTSSSGVSVAVDIAGPEFSLAP